MTFMSLNIANKSFLIHLMQAYVKDRVAEGIALAPMEQISCSI